MSCRPPQCAPVDERPMTPQERVVCDVADGVLRQLVGECATLLGAH